MTREEALKKVEGCLIDYFPLHCYEEVEEIMKALKQEPILDKIRAEIVEMWQHEPCAIESGCLDEVLEVIDKYKAESEE